jgi:hypothetical protein
MHPFFRRALVSTGLTVALLAPTAAFAGDGTGLVASPALTARPALASAAGSGPVDSLRSAYLRSGPKHAQATRASVVPVSTPTITSPTDGSTVGGEVTLSVISSAPLVEVSVYDNGMNALQAPVQVDVVDGVASTAVSTLGHHNGAYRVFAADCDTEGCGPTVEVSFSIYNDPPVITAPTPGTVIGASFTASATASGGVVVFYLDASHRASDDTAPYSVSISTAGSGEGSHLLTAQICTTAEAYSCAEASAPVELTVAALHPVITGLSNPTVSPNGDGAFDDTTIHYDLPEPQRATLTILDPLGVEVFGPVVLQSTEAQGSFDYLWSGKYADGSWATQGTHVVRIDTVRADPDGPLPSRTEALVEVDVQGPVLSKVTGGGSTFYPVRDSYRDLLTMRITASEPTSSSRLVIRNSTGSAVRRLSLPARPAGRLTLTWNGRRANGTLVAAGHYTFEWQITDSVGNRRSTSRYRFGLSHKKLTRVSRSKTVTALGSLEGKLVGACSDLFKTPYGWTNGVGYLSNVYCQTSEEDLAAGVHNVTLPWAIKYGSVKVAAYGRGAASGHRAALLYLNKASEVSDYGCALSSRLDWYGCPSAPVSVTSRDLRWITGTTGNHWYAVKAFKVSWTSYVLR